MEQNENKTQTIADVANGIKRDLRNSFKVNGEYYAMLFLLKRLIGLEGSVGLSKILEWWVKALDEGKISSTNGVTVLNLTMNAYHFALAVQKANRYFKFASGEECLEENDEPYGSEAIKKTKIGLSDNFRNYINTLSENDRKVLQIDLGFKYSEAVFKVGTEKLIQGDYSRNEPIEQYDEPKPNFNSNKEELDWEAEHDEILKEFKEERKTKETKNDYEW